MIVIEERVGVMHGAPCFAGARIPLYVILEKLAAGYTIQEIADSYGALERGHIIAALEYAADALGPPEEADNAPGD